MEKQMINLSTFEDCYQKLIQHFTGHVFKEELTLAQKEFFDNAGTLDENKPNYSLRMSQFFDWYFLTRPLKSHMQTPVMVCEQQRDLRLTEDDIQTLQILKNHQHSIFEYIKNKNNEMHIKNIYKNEKITVVADQMIFSFDEKEFFEARIVQIENKNYYLKGFCFHPESAQKFILDQTTLFRKNPDLNYKEFLVRLNKMRYKFEQYKHVKPEMIYSNENKLGL
jgi:hypothetical protein